MTGSLPAAQVPQQFLLRFVAGTVGFFGVLRLPWVIDHVLLPFTTLQADLAARVVGPAALPVYASLECSGTDVIALCLSAIGAYPAPWRRRLLGMSGGLLLILTLNVLRIGSLGQVAAEPARFVLWHVYIWPGVLTLAVGAYVLVWLTGFRLRRTWLGDGTPWTTFVRVSLVLVPLFVLAAPIYLQSPLVAMYAGVIATGAAAILSAIGVPATAEANVLYAPMGPLLVTQECVTTPLIPVYLAAVTAYVSSRPARVAAWVAAVPLFAVLGMARLLVVAVPATVVVSPLALVHAFYQIATGAVVVAIAAIWQHRRAALGPMLGAWVAAMVVGVLTGEWYSELIRSIGGWPVADPQQAIALLPPFQLAMGVGLCVAFWPQMRWRRAGVGLCALILLQVVTLAVFQWVAGAGMAIAVRDVRAWAVVAPVVVMWACRRPGQEGDASRAHPSH